MAKPGGRPRKVDIRQVINAIFYVLVTGCQWRQLSTNFPPWQPCTGIFASGAMTGQGNGFTTRCVPKRQQAGRDKHPTAGCLDSRSVKASANGGERGYDAGNMIKGHKRHLLVDTMGLLLVIVVTAASMFDPQGAKLVFGRLRGAGKKLRRI